MIITPSIAKSAIIFVFLLQTRMYLFLYNYYVMEDWQTEGKRMDFDDTRWKLYFNVRSL